MKLAISITTYERPELLKNLLENLMYQSCKFEAEILIVDDGSTKDYSKVMEFTRGFALKDGISISWLKNSRNFGKKDHWKIVDRIFKWFRGRQWDYAIYLQDDCDISGDFISDLLYQFDSIQDQDKVCLNYMLLESRKGKPVWTGVHPVEWIYDDVKVYCVGWVDLHFVANRLFFEALEWIIPAISRNRWRINPKLSSGVGRYISKKLHSEGYGMYQVTESLADHSGTESLMNPESRKENPNFNSV